MNFTEILAQLLARATGELSGLDLVSAHETEDWEGGSLDALLEIGFLRPAQPSQTVLCPACDEGHEAEVVLLPGPGDSRPRAYITCPCYGMVAVDPAAQRRWRIDPAGLAAHLAGALTHSEARQLGLGIWHLGSLESDGKPRDLLLSIESNVVDGQTLQGFAQPIVLCPGPFAKEGAPQAALLRLLGLSNGRAAIDQGYLDALLQPPDPDMTPYLFRQTGEIWTVVFEGRTHRFKDRVGFHYLQEILRHPGQLIPAATLYAAVHRQSLAPSTEEDDDEHERAELAGLGMQGDLGEVLDEEALKAYRQRVNQLRAEIGDAGDNLEHARKAALQEELDLILDELSRAQGPKRKPRRVGQPSANIRSSVTQALSAAKKLLTDADPRLGEHLRLFLTTGKDILYAPDPRIPWVF